MNSIPLSKKIGLVTEPIVALKRTIKVKPQERVSIDLIVSVNESEEIAKKNLDKYKSYENIKSGFELSKARVEAESRYLRIKGNDIKIYQQMLSYIIFDNSVKSQTVQKNKEQLYKQEELWKYGISGDLPIILVKIRNVNDQYVIKEVFQFFMFYIYRKRFQHCRNCSVKSVFIVNNVL